MTNLLIRSDALHLQTHAPANAAQLVYLDPPFGAGGTWGARPRGPACATGERARRNGPVAYTDRWSSIEAYVHWLEPRLVVARDCLASNGTMWLHLDHRAVHDAKVVCDRVFGRASFLGEVVWAQGNGARGARRGPATTHQTLLIYARGHHFIWNARDPSLREPFSPTSMTMHFGQTDAGGRRYRDRTVGGKTYRYFADEGRAIGSVWTDCPSMAANTPLLRETTGYPTQKPLKLLERIVRASTSADGLVIDPFCGSGTALVASFRNGRPFVGCDLGQLAIETSSRRLEAEGAPFETRLDSERCPGATKEAFIPSF
ncbi:MAG: site-specific DNA-methyltransferase [Myxococcota bacterium]|nr:site-specific DNA-methyltransferase [Myxococcota bacterium]